MESAGRLRRVAFDSRQIAAHAPGDSDEGAAGPQAGDEMGDPAGRLFNNLRSGGLEVRLPVGRVVILIRVKVTIGLGGIDLADLSNGAVGTLTGIGEHDFSAKGFQNPLAF